MMLVLKRKEGQSIDVGDNVRIVLREIRGGHAKIGIVAPKDVRVKRTEIEESVARENIKAVESSSDIKTRLSEIVQKLDPEHLLEGG
jgi:carbon storage regulator